MKRPGHGRHAPSGPTVFNETSCALFVVPPNRRNHPAIRVYEKAGFVPTEKTWMGHMIMEMTRERYQELYELRPLR